MPRALVVEDNDLWRDMLTLILSEMGYACDSADKLKKAVLFGDVFEVVILDLELPDATGVEALDTLRPLLKSAAICVVSGYIREADVMHIIRHGADTVATKPLTLDRLKRDIETAVAHRREDSDALRKCAERLGA